MKLSKKILSLAMVTVFLAVSAFSVSASFDTCSCGYCSSSSTNYMWGPEECETLYVISATGRNCYVSVDTSNVGVATSVSTYEGVGTAWASVTFYANMYWGDPYVSVWHS